MADERSRTDIELHRPYIDEVTLKLPGVRQADAPAFTEVIDCWYDSGSMPFAQWHYPFENKEVFREALPGQLHFRGYGPDPRLVLHAGGHLHRCCSTARPLKTASCMGHVQDAEGRKMSKHLGNVVDPWSCAG